MSESTTAAAGGEATSGQQQQQQQQRSTTTTSTSTSKTSESTSPAATSSVTSENKPTSSGPAPAADSAVTADSATSSSASSSSPSSSDSTTQQQPTPAAQATTAAPTPARKTTTPPPSAASLTTAASPKKNVQPTPTATATASAGAPYPKGRKERPCDACRRRKSRCVMNEGAEKCVLCQFHSQECTFVQSPQPRKRRLPSTQNNHNSDPKDRETKRTTTEPTSPRSSNGSSTAASDNLNSYPKKPIRDSLPIADYSILASSQLKETLGLQAHRHSHYIGPTSEYESCLIDLCPFDSRDEHNLAGSCFRRVSHGTTFVMFPDEPTPNHGDIFHDLDKIERMVAPHGEKLVRLYFRIVHPSFPVLHKRVFLEKYARTHREFSPPLLAAVYILALHWWNYDRDLATQKKPDVAGLEKLAAKTLADVMHRPKLSTVQAGLLLLQKNEEIKGSSWALTAQLVAIGQELGLHIDCSDWRIPRWEKGLRKRLAWGLYMQDKWGALTHGRPSHISKANWAVPMVEPEDFPDSVEREESEENEDGSQEVEKGRMLFEQMIELTRIMADVLDTFFTIEAQMGVAGRGGTQKVLERAKPIQLRLKEWFMRLPECLRMDAQNKSRKLSSTGYLHLAYFATEITLHRQILRTLSPPTNVDSYLLYICRSAAKTRLISAMDFVNRLKPEHLQSFWYFASKLNFALIGTFGSLLWATSPTWEEADFYKARLSEYRWTLRVSSRGAEFMEFAVRVLDASSGYLQQEMFKKRGLQSQPPGGYRSTVSEMSKFGLGMGAGVGVDMNAPPPPPPPGWGRTRKEEGPISPITADGEDVVEMDEDDPVGGAMGIGGMRMDGDPGEGPEDDEMDMDGEGDGEGESDGEIGEGGEMDFFMIPNHGGGSSGE